MCIRDRIRFRASDFGLVAKINIIRGKSKQASCAEMLLGSFVFLLVRVIQQLGFWTQKIQANVDYYCYVRRRAESTSLVPGLEHPSLCSDSSLAAKRRAEALHVVFFSEHPSPARELLLCAYSRMIRSHERRALGALLSLFSRSCLLYTSPSPRDS